MSSPRYQNVRFVQEGHPGFRAHVNRAKAIRQAGREAAATAAPQIHVVSATGPTESLPADANTIAAPIEVTPVVRPLSRSYTGRVGERAARRLIGDHAKLSPERILTYRRPGFGGEPVTDYQELDGVCWLDRNGLIIYEVKLTYLDNMRNHHGIGQLNHAAAILKSASGIYTVRKRLVYVAEPGVAKSVDGPFVQPTDLQSEFGIIWITPSQLEWAASDLGRPMPEGWRSLWAHHDDNPSPLGMAA